MHGDVSQMVPQSELVDCEDPFQAKCARRRAAKGQPLARAKHLRLLTASLGLFVSGAFATDSGMSMHLLAGAIYVVEDNHYDNQTNSLVYFGPRSVTVIGATWTPDTARILATRIRSVSKLPISEVIDPSPDPEWSGGNAYWRSIGARICAVDVTYQELKRSWATTVESARKNHPGYPALPLVLPTEIYSGEFQLQDGNVRAFFLGPSHTPADIFIYFPREKVLDAGSILKEHLGNMAHADVHEYPNTLHKLQELHLDIRTIVSGHWSPIHGPELIDMYLELLRANP
jgi:metallo-beta-lactamase class B